MPRSPLLIALTLAFAGLAPAAHAQDENPNQENPNQKQTTATPAKVLVKTAAATPRRTAPIATETPKSGPAVAVATPTLKGGGELGYASANGNSTTESLNGRLDVTYSDGIWKHSANLFGLRSRSEYMLTNDDGSIQRTSRTTANRYTLGANSAYMTDARGTINTSLRLEEDDFGTYSRQQSLSLSYGNRVIDSERTQLDLQFGPGYRSAHDALENRTEAGLIGRGLFDLRYALTDNTEIVNKLLVESGEYNTFAQNDLGVAVTMNAHLALKAGWQARHNSDVAPDLKKTDTLTTMNVVYKFK